MGGRVAKAGYGDVRRIFLGITLDPRLPQRSVYPAFEGSEFRLALDARPDDARFAAWREVPDAFQAKVEEQAGDERKRVGHVVRLAVVQLADEAECQMELIVGHPADVTEPAHQRSERLFDFVWKVQGDEQAGHGLASYDICGGGIFMPLPSIEDDPTLAKRTVVPYLRRLDPQSNARLTMRSRDSGNSDEFIREVDEAVRQDRWLTVWQQYNTYIIGAVLALVIGTTAGIGWRSYQESQRSANAKALAGATALLSDERPAEASAAFKALAESAGGGVAVVARLRAAEAEQQAGNVDAKLALLESLAGDSEVSSLYQRLAGVLAKQEAFSDSDADTMIDELDQAATPDNPWRASLIELKAIAEMKAGRTEEARGTLETLLESEDTPANLQRRAGELLNALGGPLEGDNQAVSQNSSDDTDAAIEGEAVE